MRKGRIINFREYHNRKQLSNIRNNDSSDLKDMEDIKANKRIQAMKK